MCAKSESKDDKLLEDLSCLDLPDISTAYSSAETSQASVSVNPNTFECVVSERWAVQSGRLPGFVQSSRSQRFIQQSGRAPGLVQVTLRQTLVNENKNPPTEDTLFAYFCRAMQKFVREALRLLRSGAVAVVIESKSQAIVRKLMKKAPGLFNPDIVSQMIGVVERNCEELEPISRPHWQPATFSPDERPPKNYNKTFCKYFFAVPAICELYYLFLDLLFEYKTPATLCARFKHFCCRSKAHSEECEKKWLRVEFMLKYYFVEQLFDPSLMKGKHIAVVPVLQNDMACDEEANEFDPDELLRSPSSL